MNFLTKNALSIYTTDYLGESDDENFAYPKFSKNMFKNILKKDDNMIEVSSLDYLELLYLAKEHKICQLQTSNRIIQALKKKNVTKLTVEEMKGLRLKVARSKSKKIYCKLQDWFSL